MAARVNPKEKKLLEDFVDYLENRGGKNGWVIVEKPSYEGGVENKKKTIHIKSSKIQKTIC